MQARATPLCALDDTWEDVLAEFTGSLKGTPTWSCHCIDGVDKEVILSAPEIMDPKTDSGFGYQDVRSLQGMLDSQEIPSSALLLADGDEEARLLDMMDFIHVKELAYLEGYSLTQSYLSFPYFLRMDLLKAENPALHAYCRGVLRTLDCVLRAVFATTIRSDEEFMMVPPELDRAADCPLGELLAELETAAARAKTPAVAARLRFRKQLLSGLSLFLEAKRRSDVEAACDLCAEALAILKGVDYGRAAEPAVDPRLVREKEVSFWVSTMTPTKPLPVAKFADAMATYATMLRQLASLKALLALKSLSSIADFVEAFGAQQPLLPIRSVAVVVLFSRDANESFLFGLPIQQRLLEMIAKEYGAPLYLRIYEGDEAALESVVKYRVNKALDPHHVTPADVMSTRHQTADAVRRWASEAAKNFLVRLETMLCNRGLAHRRLMKNMPALGQLQELSYSVDINIFLATQPGVTGEGEAECVRACTVLTFFTNTLVLRAMELIVQLQLELDLLIQGELLPALWYLNFAQRAQTENLAMLCLQNTKFIPETRVNKKTKVPLHNLALTTRTTGTVDATRVNVLDATRLLSDSVFISACLMEHQKLVNLTDGPKHAMTTVEDIFNHRMLKCFGAVHSPPFTSYARCLAVRPDLGTDDSRVPGYARKSCEVAIGAAAKMRAVLTAPATAGASGTAAAEERVRRESLAILYGGFEKAAKTVAASLASFYTMCTDKEMMSKYTTLVDRSTLPYIINFALHKKD